MGLMLRPLLLLLVLAASRAYAPVLQGVNDENWDDTLFLNACLLAASCGGESSECRWLYATAHLLRAAVVDCTVAYVDTQHWLNVKKRAEWSDDPAIRLFENGELMLEIPMTDKDPSIVTEQLAAHWGTERSTPYAP